VQHEQMMLDARRTPNLTAGQEAELISMLSEHCVRRSSCENALCENYVQGMHLLAACPLWAGLAGAAAAEVFEFVLDTLCGRYYRDDNFAAFKRDVSIVDTLIEERLPHLSTALRAAGVPMMLLTFDPLLCLFTLHLPHDVVLRLWDVLLFEGSAAIFAMLLVLLEHLLPEAAEPPDRRDGGDDSREAFPFVEKFHERAACLAVEDLEPLLGRVRILLEGPDPDEAGGAAAGGLRQRIQELRAEAAGFDAEEHTAGAWWEHAATRVRGWLELDKESGSLLSKMLALPPMPPDPASMPPGAAPPLWSPPCGQM